MASGPGSEFESSFGERATDEPLGRRLRDRNLSDDVEHVESVSLGAEAPDVVVGESMLTPAEPAHTVGTGEVGTRWQRIRPRLLAASSLIFLAGVLFFIFCLFQVWSTGRSDDDQPVDAIVVMGAAQYDGRPSPQLAARLDHVLELWPTGVAPFVVVTGGNIPGDRFTEAEASAQYLIERGVPESALILENAGSNSYDSLDSVQQILRDRGLEDVLIVTDPYHALRSRLIAEEVGLDASVSSTDTSVVTGSDSLVRHVKEAGGVAVGRIIGFDRLADLVD